MSKRAVSPDLLKRVARRRAAGVGWQVIADGLGRKRDAVAKWPARYPDLWATYYAEATGEVVAEGKCEAMAVLRHTMRHDDPKISLTATGQFLRVKPPAGGPPAAADDDAVRMAQYARSLTDADLARLAAEAAVCAGGSVPPPGPE